MENTAVSIRFPVLIGDIGGTNARFALIADPDADWERLPDIRTADHATVEDAIADVVLAQTSLRPKTAILALAGPIAGEAVSLTNCPWMFEPRKLIPRFGLSAMILLNDFEALSLCLPGLRPGDVDPIGGGRSAPERPRVVVGPGTGLGAGALIHARGAWIPVPGEGGHIDLGPVTERDFALWPHFEKSFGRFSAETLLCGPGLMRIYQGIAGFERRPAPFSTPAEVTAAGLAGNDPTSVEALDFFVTHLGRLAGNLALVFVATGGVYLAGGISAKIAPALKSGAFREAFVAKDPHRHIMEEMVTAIVVKPDPALSGIADFARHPDRFGVELGGKLWQA
ncbi:MAG TPA: glucokinase [Bauldia sp.]|nr:glucokinase [Bauldia sp.]